MKYFLSNRQIKELVGRASPIVVALPCPPDRAEKLAAACGTKIVVEPINSRRRRA